MFTRQHSHILRSKSALMGTSILFGAASMLLAASAANAQAAPAQADDQGVETVTVTGYRASLEDSTNFKRNAIGFSDSVFAEDIGKFPDTNVAEALNRIPGVTISRDIDGEGLNVSIRGLGTNFVRITLNNAAIAVASTGATDQTDNNREVDLNMFPTELFTQLTVTKSPTASQLEGGAAGVVNMRSARPFDNPGMHFSYNVQGTDQSIDGAIGKRGTLLASDTEGPFGLLIGISGVQNPVMTKGWEDGNAGWVGASLSSTQCTASSCGSLGSKSWPVAATVGQASAGVPALLVPIPSGYTLSGGATPYASGGTNYFPANYAINQNELLALNPGLNITQISNALLPRLGRTMFEEGTRDRYNSVISAEYRPTDDLRFYFDFIFGRTFNNLNRSDIDWGVRSGAGSQSMIPANLVLQPDWLNYTGNAGGAVKSGTFYGAGFFLEARPYDEKGDFYSFNPGMDWQVSDLIHVDAQVNASRSHFFRDSPTIFVTTCSNTPLAAGVPNCAGPTGGDVVTYNDTGAYPSITSSLDLNNPANFIWNNGRVNLQDEKRYTETNGAHINATYGGDDFKVSVGGAYDDSYRFMEGIDDSNQWQDAVCADNPNVFLAGINGTPVGCNGQNTPTPVGQSALPSYGVKGGYSYGFPPLTYSGSLIPASALVNYLVPGPTGFITANYNKIFQATNYYAYDQAAIKAAGCPHDSYTGCTQTYPWSTTTATSDVSGAFDEKDWSMYAEADGDLHLGERSLKYDFGLRWSETHQDIVSPITNVPAANATLSAGGTYPTVYTFGAAKHTYQAFLPSASFVYEVADDFQVRLSLSRTMTRPNPSQMIAAVNFSDLTAQNLTLGNPALKPYFSDNIDLGFEYYTGAEGYIAATAFRKDIAGFTSTTNVTEPFSYLDQFGVNWAALNVTQQAALCGRTPGCSVGTATDATVANTTVTVSEPVNAPGLEIINGMEFDYVQPLDFLLDQYGLDGFGFNGNLTILDQESTGSAAVHAPGVPSYQYNVTGYYENSGISTRLSYVFNAKSYASGPNQQSVCLPVGSSSLPAGQNCPSGAYLFSAPYGQADFSSSVKLSKLFGELPSDPELTFDVQNLFSAKQVTYDQIPDAVHSYYIKGQTFLLGIRGTF
jgi:TonB-dependent receptor